MFLNENSDIPDVNKINDTDVNMIKEVVNENENSVLSGWYSLPIDVSFEYASYDSSVKTGTISTSIDLASYLSLGMKVKFSQNGTIKYAFITKINNNQLTLYMGNDYSLSNSTISNFYYSMLKAPYGFPIERSSWDIIKEFTSSIQISNPTSGNYYKLTNVDITVPIGSWEIGWQGNTYPQRSGSGTNEQQSGLSTSTNNFTHLELNTASFSNTTQCMQGVSKSHDYNITEKTIFNFIVRTTQTNMISIGLYNGNTYGYSKLFAKCQYL